MKDRINFDPATIAESDVIGAYLRSADGTLISHTADGAKDRLDVNVGAEYLDGAAFAGGERGLLMLGVNSANNYSPLRLNADGELIVDVQVTSGSDKEEDSAHVSADIGTYVLSVREDTLASSTSLSGDYQSFKSDSLGQLWVRVGQIAKADGFASSEYGVETVGVAAAQIISTPLTGRKKVWLQNASPNRSIYIGFDNSVTATNGFRLSAGSVFHEEIGDGIDLYAIASGAAANLRYHEYA